MGSQHVVSGAGVIISGHGSCPNMLTPKSGKPVQFEQTNPKEQAEHPKVSNTDDLKSLRGGLGRLTQG